MTPGDPPSRLDRPLPHQRPKRVTRPVTHPFHYWGGPAPRCMSPRVPLLAWDPWKGRIRAGNRSLSTNGALEAPIGPFSRKRFLAPGSPALANLLCIALAPKTYRAVSVENAVMACISIQLLLSGGFVSATCRPRHNSTSFPKMSVNAPIV